MRAARSDFQLRKDNVMKPRKVFLVLELDADEVVSLPPHLQGLLQRPLVDPIQTREAPPANWFPTEEQKREKRRQQRKTREGTR
jgi:hypothetical protein